MTTTGILAPMTDKQAQNFQVLTFAVERERKNLNEAKARILKSFEADWVQSQDVDALAQIGGVNYSLRSLEEVVSGMASGEVSYEDGVASIRKAVWGQLQKVSFEGRSSSQAANLLAAKEGAFWQRLAGTLDWMV